MSEDTYEETNRLLRELSEDLELPFDVFDRVYIGSGEDVCITYSANAIN